MIVVVANQKGGTGKTTTALTLAHLMHLEGDDVALVDLDAPSERRPIGNLDAKEIADAVGIPAFTLDDPPAELPEFIVADCPPDLANEDFRDFITLADVIVIPGSLSPRDLKLMMFTADYVRERLGRQAAMLLWRVPTVSLGRAEQIRRDLREAGYDVLDTSVRVYAEYDRAEAEETTIAGLNTVESRRAASDYQAVLHELKRRYRKGARA